MLDHAVLLARYFFHVLQVVFQTPEDLPETIVLGLQTSYARLCNFQFPPFLPDLVETVVPTAKSIDEKGQDEQPKAQANVKGSKGKGSGKGSGKGNWKEKYDANVTASMELSSTIPWWGVRYLVASCNRTSAMFSKKPPC